MHRISGFKLKSTVHRVLDIGVQRLSSPFFLEPAYYSQVPSDVLAEIKDNDFLYGEWLINAMSAKYGEWKDFKK